MGGSYISCSLLRGCIYVLRLARLPRYLKIAALSGAGKQHFIFVLYGSVVGRQVGWKGNPQVSRCREQASHGDELRSHPRPPTYFVRTRFREIQMRLAPVCLLVSRLRNVLLRDVDYKGVIKSGRWVSVHQPWEGQVAITEFTFRSSKYHRVGVLSASAPRDCVAQEGPESLHADCQVDGIQPPRVIPRPLLSCLRWMLPAKTDRTAKRNAQPLVLPSLHRHHPHEPEQGEFRRVGVGVEVQGGDLEILSPEAQCQGSLLRICDPGRLQKGEDCDAPSWKEETLSETNISASAHVPSLLLERHLRADDHLAALVSLGSTC